MIPIRSESFKKNVHEISKNVIEISSESEQEDDGIIYESEVDEVKSMHVT